MPDTASSVAPPTFVGFEGMRARSPWRSTATIVAEYCLIAISIAASSALHGFWAYCLVALFVGTRQYALGECMAHEASHRNLSREVWLNEALGFSVCWPFFFTLAGYRRFHNRLHHGVSLTSDGNSIYEDYEDWRLPSADTALSPRGACWHLVVRPLTGVIGVRHLIKTVEDFYWDGDLAENAVMLLFWAVIFIAAAYGGWLPGLMMYWIVPWLTVLPILNFWSEVGDHYRVTDAETRSNLSPLLNRFIAHNIGFHALHHRYPSIPWFRLPHAYLLCRHELREQVSKGYVMTLRQIMAEERALRIAAQLQGTTGSIPLLAAEK